MGLLRLGNGSTSSMKSSSSRTATTTAITHLTNHTNHINHTNTVSNNTTTTTTTTTTAAMTLCQNGSVPLCQCVSSMPTNSTHGMLSNEGSLDALLYIVVVLLFYAFSIVVLMVKYIRRENKEAYLRQYFDDFVARDQFQSAQTRNQICLKNILEKPDLRGHISLELNPGTDDDQDHNRLLPESAQFCIPETISELAEDDEEVEFESAEDELLDERFHSGSVQMESDDQVSSFAELLPRQETPV